MIQTQKILIAFIRHGAYCKKEHVPGAQGLFPLNTLGQKQAIECANSILRLSDEHKIKIHSEIFCSDVLRAYETGHIIADEISRLEGRSFKLCNRAALRERSLGVATNLTTNEIETMLSLDSRRENLPVGWKRIGDYRLPVSGAESLLSAGQRCYKFIDKTMMQMTQREGINKLILFIGHAGAFRYSAFLMKILSWSEAQMLSMDNCSPIVFRWIKPGLWRHIEGEWKLASGNKS